jgi:hypothetical protein
VFFVLFLMNKQSNASDTIFLLKKNEMKLFFSLFEKKRGFLKKSLENKYKLTLHAAKARETLKKLLKFACI